MEDTSIRQKYMNALATQYRCLGRKKADRNEYSAEHYRLLLEAAGEAVPTHDEAFKVGVFNGEGAS